MRILVTGASGFIGCRFCERAAQAGHEVTALLRPRQSPGPYPPADRVVYGQLPYSIPLRAWEGVDAVAHCAAATTGQGSAESAATNAEGTRVLLAQAAVSGAVKRFIFLSTQSAHEGAVSAYGYTKREAETLVREAGLPYAILRPGLVFGPGESGLFYRMRRTVERLPFIPLLGGGNAIVQPIEVDDLCEAMLRCLDFPPEESLDLNLGDPVGMPLREFLQAISLPRTGRPKLQMKVPLGPVKAAVATAQALRLPCPVSMDNLRGMEKVRRMETRPSLERLKLKLQPFRPAMRRAVLDAGTCAAAPSSSPLRILLIGGGKVGIVHALNLFQREDAVLCGIVDPNPKAFRLYRSMGFTTAFRTDTGQALDELCPDGAIIATPAHAHLALTKLCAGKGVAVLSEKPLAVRQEDIPEYLGLEQRFRGQVLQVGYMAAQFPHLDRAVELLVGGNAGKVVRFWAFSLQSHIMAPRPQRWEMLKEKAGGGALINFGVHVLSMLVRLLGLPESFSARMWPVHSAEVEDAIEVQMYYPEFTGRFFVSWSVPGYSRPENRIVIELEQGRLIIENYCTRFQKEGKTEQIWTQRSFDIGYNAAPDYTGGGFSMEHGNFTNAIRTRLAGQTPPHDGTPSQMAVRLGEAARLEGLVFDIYSRAVKRNLHGPEWQSAGADPLDEHMNEIIARLLP